MKTLPYLIAAIMMTGYAGISTAEDTSPAAPQPNPMMYGPGPQGQPMPPYMKDRMMHMRHHQKMMEQQQSGAMPMAPGPMARGSHVCHHQGKKGMRGDRMHMMRDRMEKMEAHMQNVDKHLTNIEALLKQMLEKMK